MKKRTEEEIKEIVESRGYIYIDNYFVNNGLRKVIVQDDLGYKYDIYLSHFLKNQISFVSKSNPFTLSYNIPLWLKLNDSQFELLEDNKYKGNNIKLNLYCNKCKDYPKMSWVNILKGKGCGICEGKQVGLYHSLAIQRPDIAKEWHPTKNGNINPKDVRYGSAKKAWWLCPNGHEYFSSINGRTTGKGCKKCSDSQHESKIANELKSYILNKYDAKEEYPIFINPETNCFLPFDIYIFGGNNPKINGVYIEIHWYQHYRLDTWHKRLANKKRTTPEEEFEYQKHKDRLKRKFARKNGIYIEIDLRKIKTTEQAIKYVESILNEKHRRSNYLYI